MTDNFNYVTSRRTEGQLDGVSAYEKQPDHTHLRDGSRQKTRQAPLADKTINTQTPPADKTANTEHQIERTALYIEVVRRIKIDPAKDYKLITGVPHRPTLEITLKIF